MRKSKQVLLSAVLITAISGIKAEAQQACNPAPLEPERADTPVHHTSRAYYGGGGGHGFLYGLFHFRERNNHNQSVPVKTTSHPRTGGFGNTLRSSFAGS